MQKALVEQNNRDLLASPEMLSEGFSLGKSPTNLSKGQISDSQSQQKINNCCKAVAVQSN